MALQLRDALRRSGRSQQSVAADLGKSQARISELLRSLEGDTPLNDRLTLLTSLADLLGLEPVLVPRKSVEKVLQLIGRPAPAPMTGGPAPSLFDDVFIDLREPDDEDDDRPFLKED